MNMEKSRMDEDIIPEDLRLDLEKALEEVRRVVESG